MSDNMLTVGHESQMGLDSKTDGRTDCPSVAKCLPLRLDAETSRSDSSLVLFYRPNLYMSVRFGSVWLGSLRVGSGRVESSRVESGRLGSARLGVQCERGIRKNGIYLLHVYLS